MASRTRISYLASILALTAVAADEIVLPETVVRASRAEQSLDEIPAHVTVMRESELHRSAAQTTDDLLRQAPAFSLFRRSSSIVAHPTSQGVSLRGIGASGASRALVLLDGMPLNDPFGGWVQWSKVDPWNLENVEILRGGGSHIWGNYALSGVVDLKTKMLERSMRLTAGRGSGSTNKIGISVGERIGGTAVNMAASYYDTDGYFVLRDHHRGSIDEPARSQHGVLSARLRRSFGNGARLFAQGGIFLEERGNGTPLTGNSTDAGYFGLHTTWSGRAQWKVSGFLQQQTFESSFSSQAGDRESERPALEQFRVPATAVGLTFEWLRPTLGNHLLVAGSDLRQSTGRTNERYRNLGDGFTRRRRAGGTQQFAGFFLQDVIRWKERWQFTLGSRIDFWRFSNGSRRELDLEAAGILRDDDYKHRRGIVLGPKAGVRYRANSRLALRSSAYHTFRTPTLNELYRPFRVRNDITEANRRLEPERLTGGEVGIDVTPGFMSLRVTGYWNEVEDAIANLTIGPGPGQVVPCGFVPEGGSCRQRGNLERTRIRGLEADATILDRNGWSLSMAYLFSDSEVRRAKSHTELRGKQLAQVPKHRFHSTLRYARAEIADCSLALRYTGKQFEDDLNSLALGRYATLDLAVRRELTSHYNLFVNLENLSDTEIEVGRSSSLTSVGSPRRIFAGVRASLGP
jgi:outer membrane cobalamin receptor